MRDDCPYWAIDCNRDDAYEITSLCILKRNYHIECVMLQYHNIQSNYTCCQQISMFDLPIDCYKC